MLDAARSSLDSGEAEKASLLLEEAVKSDPECDEAFLMLGVSYAMQARKPEAITAFFTAIEKNPQCIKAYCNLCFTLAEERDFKKAIKYGEKGLEIDPTHINIYNALAFALSSQGRFDEAIAYLRKALSIKGDDVRLYKNLWDTYYRIGRKEEAEDILLEYLKVRPDDLFMHRMLSLVRKYEPGDEHIARMEDMLPIAPDKVDLHFALGRAYEGIGEYRKSFMHYEMGNASYRQKIEYSEETTEIFFEQLKQVYTKDFIEQNKVPEQDKVPVFIVGMPRSGTSLAEQILASHPDVFGGGELDYIFQLQSHDMNLNLDDYVASVRNLNPDDFKTMAELYLGRLEKVWAGNRCVTDKMPQNFMYVGLIKTLFPNAKIIHCMRDPRDNCFSIFKTCFFAGLEFAYSQNEIVGYYKLHADLMAHWHSLFPGEIHDLRYEALVENPEEEIRDLLEYCDLEWHDGCLDFHKTKRVVKTTSALQVRKPLYKGAVGYWKNYEPYLEEIVSAFDDAA